MLRTTVPSAALKEIRGMSEIEKILTRIEEEFSPEDPTGEDKICAICGTDVHVPDHLEWQDGDICHPCTDRRYKNSMSTIPRLCKALRYMMEQHSDDISALKKILRGEA